MALHHYLGDLAKIGETLWYVATWRAQWVALLSVSAAALKCGVRDHWIGWDFTSQYGRLKRIANNCRFLILPDWHHPNVGSRVLSLMQRRVVADWQARFGHPVLEIAVGLTSQTSAQANPQQVLAANRGLWTIENRCHYVIDWNFDEDRSRIRTGLGPENVTRLRRFAVGVLALFSDRKTSNAQKMSKLNRNTRLVFDCLRMTKNSTRRAAT